PPSGPSESIASWMPALGDLALGVTVISRGVGAELPCEAADRLEAVPPKIIPNRHTDPIRRDFSWSSRSVADAGLMARSHVTNALQHSRQLAGAVMPRLASAAAISHFSAELWSPVTDRATTALRGLTVVGLPIGLHQNSSGRRTCESQSLDVEG